MSLHGSIAYRVTTDIEQLFSAPGSTMTLFNDGPALVYLSTSPRYLAAAAIPLPLGASTQWDAGKPCYAATFTPTGQASIRVTDNSGAINDPTALAGAILAGGLATQIAAAIAATQLDVSAATVAISSGVPLDVSAAQVNITGAQVGATSAGGFTVPDTSTSFSGSGFSPINGSRTISGVAGKHHTLRSLSLGLVTNSSGFNQGGNLTVTITDILTSQVLFTYTLYTGSGPAGNLDVAAAATLDLLGIAGTLGSGIRITYAAGGPSTLSFSGTLQSKAV